MGVDNAFLDAIRYFSCRSSDGASYEPEGFTLPGFEKSGSSLLRSFYVRLSWFQRCLVFLSEVRNVLGHMSSLALSVKDVSGDIDESKNVDFQKFKNRLTAIIDGFSGDFLPEASFADIPIFLGYEPSVRSEEGSIHSFSLYTAGVTPGFTEMPLLTIDNRDPKDIVLAGKIIFDGPVRKTEVKLDIGAAAINDVYKGKTIFFKCGTNSDKRVVVSYNAKTRVAVLDSEISFDNLEDVSYVINSGCCNTKIFGLLDEKCAFCSEFIWGADNARFDWLGLDPLQFVALTEEERLYRDTHEIPNDDIRAQTYAEKMARRYLNIFDVEFGNLKTQENASRMFQQVNNAIDQISLLITGQETKISKVKGLIDTFKDKEEVSLSGMLESHRDVIKRSEEVVSNTVCNE